MPGSYIDISSRFYGWLLLAYPLEFRREFGDQMLQVFRDCYRDQAGTGSLPGFWFRTLLDLLLTAAKERVDTSGREGVLMNRRSDAILLVGCVGFTVIAFLLHRYGIRNEVAWMLVFGYVLDAVATTGIVGNLAVFILSKTTKLNPLRTAIWTLAIVHAVLLLFIILVVSRVDPGFNLAGVVIGYVVSFLFWAALHFAWRHHPPVYS